MIGKGLASKLNRRVRIEKPVPNDDVNGAGSGFWESIGDAWAEVQDLLPSRGERYEGGINLATRPARVRLRYRTDVTPEMRSTLR